MTGRAVRAVLLGLLPVIVAAGIWRLEWDPPRWRVNGEPRRPFSAVVPPAAGLPKLVLAVHYPWYGTPTGPSGRWRHWNHRVETSDEGRVLGFHDPARTPAPGRLDIGAAHYPEGGPYDSLDPARIRLQLMQARAAGLDGFAVSWWGHETEDALGLAALFRQAGDAGLVLAPYYETGELRRRGPLGVAADLERLLERHGREAAWLRVDDRPVVFLYASHRLRPRMWDAVLGRLAARGWRLFLVADVPSPEWLAARPDWLQRFDAFHVYTPAVFLARGRTLGEVYGTLATLGRGAERPFVPAVGPGFDDRSVREPATVVPRAGVATYDQTWEAALSTAPRWLLVSTWNEWHEGSEIEPSVEYGRRFLDATRLWVERFRTTGS